MKKTIMTLVIASAAAFSTQAMAVGYLTEAMEKPAAQAPTDPFDVGRQNAKTYGRGTATVYPRSAFRGNQDGASREISQVAQQSQGIGRSSEGAGNGSSNSESGGARWKQAESVNLTALASGAGRTSTRADSYEGGTRGYSVNPNNSNNKNWSSSGGCGGFFSCLFD